MKTVHQWTVFSTVAALIVASATLSAAESARSRAERIIIPHVEYDEAPLNEVTKAIRRLGKDHDRDGHGVNIAYRFTRAGAKAFKTRQVTLNADKIPLCDLIEYVCMVSGFKCVFEDNAVVIFDSGVAMGGMQTRSYNMAPGVLQQKRTRKKAEKLRLRDDDND